MSFLRRLIPRLIWVDKAPAVFEICNNCNGSGATWLDGSPAPLDERAHYVFNSPNILDCRFCQGRGRVARRTDA